MQRLIFKWTVSRGRDTYGYNICSLWVDGRKVSSCNGGGYDMMGTVLAEWIREQFHPQLTKLRANYGSGDNTGGFYGLRFYNKKRKKHQKTWSKHCSVYLDGACGFSSIERIINKLGFLLTFVHSSRNESIYIMDKK